MVTKEQIITFDEDSYNIIKDLFKLKNLKCKFCDKKITKRNIGGFASSKEVFCRNSLCLIDYIRIIEELKGEQK